MPAYAVYSEFTAVYSVKGMTENDISSYWLEYGYMRINESLGSYFTTPFSSNNITAKDISIHFAMYGILVRTRNLRDSDELWRELDRRLSNFKTGNSPMILDDGTGLFSDSVKGNPWSNTKDYKPTFDQRPSFDQRVDPDLIQDEYDRDY